MTLLAAFLDIVAGWRSVFPQSRTLLGCPASTILSGQRQLFLPIGRRVDSSLLLPSAARCLMKNVTRPNGRDEWQIEEATERGDETGTD
jgi:hypothetical protein